MSTLYEKLCKLCEDRGISGYRMCKDIGIQPSLMTDLKSGRKKGFSAGTAQKIADYFGITVRDLIEEQEAFVCDTAPLKAAILKAMEDIEKQKSPPTKKVSGLVAAGYDDLTPENRAVIDSLIEKLLKSQSGD